MSTDRVPPHPLYAMLHHPAGDGAFWAHVQSLHVVELEQTIYDLRAELCECNRSSDQPEVDVLMRAHGETLAALIEPMLLLGIVCFKSPAPCMFLHHMWAGLGSSWFSFVPVYGIRIIPWGPR